MNSEDFMLIVVCFVAATQPKAGNWSKLHAERKQLQRRSVVIVF